MKANGTVYRLTGGKNKYTPNFSLQMQYTEDYLSERLFHFWNHENEDIAFAIFESISRRGLLLTRGTKDLIDRFVFFGVDGSQNSIHITQKSRVCFTDIPEDKLFRHTLHYGQCGIGISRRTMLNWGGFPVFYLPNHAQFGTLQEGAAGMLYYLDLATALLQVFPDFLKANNTRVNIYGKSLDFSESAQTVELCRQSIYHFMSYIKEMSGKESDDHRFLYEREWRLVSGISNALGNPFRSLTPEEQNELCAAVPNWKEPLKWPNGYVPNSEPLVNSFHFFNGVPGKETVAQLVEVIIVPNKVFADRVQNFVKQHKNIFRPDGPEIRVLATG